MPDFPRMCLRWLRPLLLTLLLGTPVRAADPVVILISIDGMRWDYLDRYSPPHLVQLAREGTRLSQLIPTFPTKTYPNHYTLVTGLRVERHGIVGNEMFDPEMGRFFRLPDRAAVTDPRWWGGEPIWITAMKQGRSTASMFWPGSDVKIHGQQPTYWYHYDHDKPHAERVNQVLAWLDLPEAERPALITTYFAAVDDAGHNFGPLAEETRLALLDVDRSIGDLLAGLRARHLQDSVTLLIVSDHGMAEISENQIVYLDDALPRELLRYDLLGPIAGLRPPADRMEETLSRLRALRHVRVFHKSNLPPSLGYTQHVRIPDVLVIADDGWEVWTRAAAAKREWASARGNHGFDSAYGSMGATFIAYGARIPHGKTLGAVENIHVYNLMCALLGITPAPNDGDDRLVRALLSPTEADDPTPSR